MAKKDNKTDVSHLDFAEKTVLINILQEQNSLLKEKYKRLEIRFKALEGKLAKNSSNSSKPPSSDIHKSNKRNPKKTTSSKEKTGRKPGGQPGHKGSYLETVSNPDEVIRLSIDECGSCGGSLKRAMCDIEKRQVFEIPEPTIVVPEYQLENKYCKKCCFTTFACFPLGITNQTQYGTRAKSLMVYMNEYQLLPYERTSEFFSTVYGQRVSPGTIVNAVNALSNRLTIVDCEIKNLLTKKDVVNCDETSVNVSGNKQWLHTVSTEQLTHYAIHEKRGKKATESIGILSKFNGIMVHDHWKSYFTYVDCLHALCNAHHLRELRFINEHHNIKWAKEMSDLLIEINKQKKKKIEEKRYFSEANLNKYSDMYDDILRKATREQYRRGTIDSRNLFKRLKNYKDSVLLFMYNVDVPFTNNLSERDIRMAKVKQKISGCFRNIEGGNNFCKIRSIISTAKKNKKNVFSVLQEAFQKIISVNDLIVDTC